MSLCTDWWGCFRAVLWKWYYCIIYVDWPVILSSGQVGCSFTKSPCCWRRWGIQSGQKWEDKTWVLYGGLVVVMMVPISFPHLCTMLLVLQYSHHWPSAALAQAKKTVVQPSQLYMLRVIGVLLRTVIFHCSSRMCSQEIEGFTCSEYDLHFCPCCR